MNVQVSDGKLIYRKGLLKRELPLQNLVWAYLQEEDVLAHMCCGMYASEIGRVIVLDQHGKKEIFQYEGMKKARELLDKIKEAAPDLPIGYTQENRARFETTKGLQQEKNW